MDLKSLGRYEIVGLLEAAPWGPVYHGHDTVTQRKVVVHSVRLQDLSPKAAEEFTDRFRGDALAASRLHHPCIARVLDFGKGEDVAYLVTEAVDGEALKARLERGARISLAEAAGLVLELLAALEHAHEAGIVHSAVRPANILFENGRVKLTGFGMASIQQSEATTGAKLGALAIGTRYMSPEQVQGRPLELRSDLFSAGVLLYELVTGTRPFEGNNAFAVIQQIMTVVPPAPRQLDPALPAWLDAVLAKALAKTPEERFASARDFANALKAPTGVAVVPERVSKSGVIALELELEYWKDIKESEDAEDFLNFLGTFPEGRFAPLAQRRLRKMGQGTA